VTDRATAARILIRRAAANVRTIVRKSPALFLAYASMRRSLRTQYRLMKGIASTVILVTGGADISALHRKAADLLLNGSPDIWARRRREQKALVHVLETSQRKKVKGDVPILEEHGKYDFIIVLARSRSEIPPELSLTVDAIVDIARPTAEHVHAVRRLLGRKPFDHATAGLVADLELSFLVPVVCKPQFSHTGALNLIASSVNGSAAPVPRLEDLPGYSVAKSWACSFLADLECFGEGKISWSDMARGVLLYGPPGTGKTLFARAFARSAGLPLICTSVSKWQSNGHLGDLLKAMRETFETARAKQPSIVFLDELDSIGDRSKFSGDYVDYSRQVVNHLLECIDGAEGRDRILVIGATNFRDAIDPALLRSGRIERHIRIELPDADERADILRYHLGTKDFGKELQEIGSDLEGWSGADLDMLAREAKARARTNNRSVQIADLLESLPPLQELSDDHARRVALHEAGHAVAGSVLSPSCKISVSIRRKFRLFGSQSLVSGLTRYEYADDSDLMPTRADFEDFICRTLAGAAAEEYLLGSRSNGFSGSVGSDLDTASAIAIRMVCSYGMGSSLRFMIESHKVDVKEAALLPAEVRDEVSQILDQQYARATLILTENSAFLEEITDELLEKQTLGAADVAAIASRNIGSIKDSARIIRQ
jgi:cell division protease FtsH